MKKINPLRFILFIIFIPFISFASNTEDSTSASVKVTVRYVMKTEKERKTARTIKDGEIGNMPISMNLTFNVNPFLWMNSGIKGISFVQDSKFHQDRTSSEFGIGYQKGKVKVFVSYGFRLIRVKEGSARGFSSSYEKKDTRSIGLMADFDLFGIENSFEGKTSYDGDGKWFYSSELRVFPFEKYSQIHFLTFHESYFGTGTYLVFRTKKGFTDIFAGYLSPEKRSEDRYRRTDGIGFGFTHTWW